MVCRELATRALEDDKPYTAKDQPVMQAIVVKFLCPTNTRGSRYKAICAAGSVTVSKSYSTNDQREAALALCAKLGWEGDLVEGGLPNGDWVYLFSGSVVVANPTRDPRRAKEA